MLAHTVSPTQSKLLYGNKPIVAADGEAFVLVKVKLKNSLGKPVPGVTPELFADREGVQIVQPGATDESGTALGYVRATSPGPVNIKARVYPPVEESSQSES